MDKRFLTFFVLSNDASRTRQLKVRTGLFKALAAFSALAFVAIAFVVYDYARIRTQLPQVHTLMEENASQKVELVNLSSKMKDLENKIAKLNLFDRKLRVIANLDVPDSGKTDQLLGIGGATGDEDVFFPSTDSKAAELVGRMKSDLDSLEDAARSQERSFTELQEHLMEKTSYLAATPSIWPTKGWVTSTFGSRTSPFTGQSHQHRGVDIANRVGTPVIAPADGVVRRVSWARALGKYVVVKHGYGTETTYGHLSKTFVSVGQRVKRGDKLASMGNTGRSTGPHLHYSVTANGVSVNPMKYILN